MVSVVMLNVVVLGVMMPSVVAPHKISMQGIFQSLIRMVLKRHWWLILLIKIVSKINPKMPKILSIPKL
jgi:hypothetical protein